METYVYTMHNGLVLVGPPILYCPPYGKDPSDSYTLG